MDQASCPECDELVSVQAPITLGQRVRCLECQAILAVIRENPLQLDWAFIEPYAGLSSDNGKDTIEFH
jgi:uncharacterized paraquat-inducible protein A